MELKIMYLLLLQPITDKSKEEVKKVLQKFVKSNQVLTIEVKVCSTPH